MHILSKAIEVKDKENSTRVCHAGRISKSKSLSYLIKKANDMNCETVIK